MLKSEIYGELESGLIFLLAPNWLKNWELDEIKACENRGGRLMLRKLKDKIKAWYYWFWHDYRGRSESYTASAKKDVKRRPWLWIGVPAGVAIAYYLFIWHLGGFL